MSSKTIIATATLAILLAGPLVVSPLAAQETKGHDHSATTAEASPSTKGFTQANDKMHKDMTIEYSGDADVDFVRSMIPHHQGAIDMAKVELEHGKDPELRKLAEEVIKAQTAEIAEMEAWLKARGQ
ncbi:DUF305 domain-containing protein [Rhizobium sp. LC145]|jgi:uncharacterized protein (DUF305 family)|uniref:CopM family metallochaperone n=1 Tax=Rhizobium sp. LC145 TaxID=1120688 RepID=UPI00062A31E3|nr:DUF305 domain-containing protein [Rhizobium sp. LC145]KKX24661.1 hypothetical protein YH62_26975 [Rhizobium sp. LC145]TKT43441.1 DUF305 domain-containing protein [Rhizobiaceae bacterium LC148]